MGSNFLFLDRDGVINERLPGDYVKSPDEFIFCTGVPEVISRLSIHFQRIIIVTNQAGIGKGLMSEHDLEAIHGKMKREVNIAGGRIDAVYHCPNLPSDRALCRKPEIGMGLQAQKDFPDIIFARSWMVGDSASDIGFGKKLGMKTALVLGKEEEHDLLQTLDTDWKGNNLFEFARFVEDWRI